MTTDIRCQLVEDISQKNDVLVIDVVSIFRFSAAVWTAPSDGSTTDGRAKCLRYALEQIASNRPIPQWWLMVGDKAFRPDNRITRHLRLWKSLQKQERKIPTGEYLEAMHESKEGLRFFGAVQFETDHLEWVNKLMTSKEAWIVATYEKDPRSIITDVLRRGWVGQNTNPPAEILNAVSNRSDLVVSVYGEFDDAEVAAAAIGKREIVAQVCG